MSLPPSPTLTDQAPVPWASFLDAFTWRQGEHVTLIGPTGSGKTTLALEILPRRRWVVALATKPRDLVLDELERHGYRRIGSWVVADPEITPRVILAPALRKGIDSVADQAQEFRQALRSIYRQRGWAVFMDEGRYIADYLKLGRDCELLWQQGRSLGISVVFCVQRPRHVPLMAYDQATHLFLWRNADDASLDRLGEIAGTIDSRQVRDRVRALTWHQVLYVNTITGDIQTTQVEV